MYNRQKNMFLIEVMINGMEKAYEMYLWCDRSGRDLPSKAVCVR